MDAALYFHKPHDTDPLGVETFLELLEGFLVSGGLGHLESVEFDGLGEGTALADGDDIADLDIPGKQYKYKFSTKNIQLFDSNESVLTV